MAVFCVGSVNVDLVYRVPHLVRPGETLAARSFTRGLGGKGANQSIAAARAGARVYHAGAVGPDAADMLDEIAAAGVDIAGIARLEVPTGHAVIAVDDAGENAIILYEGANGALTARAVDAALSEARAGDILLLQNEVNLSVHAARSGRIAGCRVIYSAAPFHADAVAEMHGLADILVLNALEAAALRAAHPALTWPEMIVTRGGDGARWHHPGGVLDRPAFAVETVVDTTGAGDCFAGTLAAALDAGLDRGAALDRAQAAAALQVTRPGAAAAMPSRSEVDAFLAGRG